MTEPHDGSATEWGRVGDDGTVYLRTATGERVVGNWQAGSAAEALSYYQRRYEDMATQIALLASRLHSGTASPEHTRSAASRLRTQLPHASVIGDLDALDDRLQALLAEADQGIEVRRQQRAQRAAEAERAKTALVDEAEQLSTSESWKATGDRFRAIVEEWQAIRGVDRRTDSALWARLSAARGAFAKHRAAHFAEQERRWEQARQRKEELIDEAEELRESDDWGPTSAKQRELMVAWKQAGLAPRSAERQLWERFRAARQAFFDRRTQADTARDEQRQANAERKRELVEQAEALDPGTDLSAARKALRGIQQQWETAGPVRRDERVELERRLGEAETRVRQHQASRRNRGPDPKASALAERLRESVDRLESKVERARAAGRHEEAAEAQASLTTQRAWLDRASQGA